MSREPPKSWDEASRRLTRVSMLAVPAIALVGAGVGYASSGTSVALTLALIFPIVLSLWLLVVRSVGQRQWKKRAANKAPPGRDA